jgi:carboxylate-amine ligase
VTEFAFGNGAPFSVGLEEELLLVEPGTLVLADVSEEVLARMDVPETAASHEAYSAEIELRSGPRSSVADAADELRGLRARAREAGAVLLGMGVHPTAAMGDVRLTGHERYRLLEENMRGLVRRTPEGALHVHVGMPDAESAIRVYNGLREHLPLLQGLSANSPYWFGLDSGLESARFALTRAFPPRGTPRPLRDMAEWQEVTDAAVTAAGYVDYTSLTWDLRPHPRLGTVEVREMDAQSRIDDVAALGALVQGLALVAAERRHGAALPAEALDEAAFRAARDGLGARIPLDGRIVPLREAARTALDDARPRARELGSDAALEGIERLLRDGPGSKRRRAAHAEGGMAALLAQAVEETAA